MIERTDQQQACDFYIGVGIAFGISSALWMGIYWVMVHFFHF